MKTLKPLAFWCKQNFPFIEESWDTMTYYEMLCKIVELLNDTVENTNELDDNFTKLKSYVENYFKDLDVQEEINNKLDEMAESGELAELLIKFLESQAVIGYDTIAKLKLATNVTNGTILKLLGQNTYTDGKGGFYRVRTRINADVPDDYNLVVLTNTTNLVAEKIYSNTEKNVITLTDLYLKRKFVFIGDSYGEGYTPDGNVTGWPLLIKTKLNLTNDECIIKSRGGASFGTTSTLFNDLINEITNDEKVTDVVIAGGYNDISGNLTTISNGMNTVKNTIKNKFPNAKILICNIAGCYTDDNHKNLLLLDEKYNNACLTNHIKYALNTYYSLFNKSFLSSDLIHPNEKGQNAISNAIVQSIFGDYNYSTFNEVTLITDDSSNFRINGNLKLHVYSKNDLTILTNYLGYRFFNAVSPVSLTFNNNFEILIGKIDGDNYVGDGYGNFHFSIGNVIFHDTSLGYINIPCTISIRNGKVYLKAMNINDAHNNYLTLAHCDSFQFTNFSVVTPTFMT